MNPQEISGLNTNLNIETEYGNLLTMITKKKAETLMLDWFGSEPLMYFDEVIAKVSEFSQKAISKCLFRFYTANHDERNPAQ